jgi:two-component system response regulator PilR (NtrC family)
MPPLRERKDDLDLLINFFIDKLNANYGLGRTGVSEKLLDEMHQYSWPGNVRELENTIHRHYILSSGPIIDSFTEENKMVNTNFNHQSDISVNESQFSLSEPHSGEPHLGEPMTDEQITDNTQLELETKIVESNYDFSEAKRKVIEIFEARFISKMLSIANGNITNAASLCGKDRSSFSKLLKKYNIQRGYVAK